MPPTFKTVTVTYRPTSNDLLIDPSFHLPIVDGDWVLWEFKDLPFGTVGQIFFPDGRIGPFQSLRLLPSGAILGEGRTEPTSATYPYKVLVLDSEVALAQVDSALINSVEGRNTSPDVLVECVELEGEFSLTVDPMLLFLFQGDTATWQITGVPAEHFVTVLFYNTPDPWRGPFETVSQSRILTGSGGDSYQVIGTGFLWDAPELTYNIELWRSDGTLVDRHDPKIDNMGEPPTGMDEGNASPPQESL